MSRERAKCHVSAIPFFVFYCPPPPPGLRQEYRPDGQATRCQWAPALDSGVPARHCTGLVHSTTPVRAPRAAPFFSDRSAERCCGRRPLRYRVRRPPSLRASCTRSLGCTATNAPRRRLRTSSLREPHPPFAGSRSPSAQSPTRRTWSPAPPSAASNPRPTRSRSPRPWSPTRSTTAACTPSTPRGASQRRALTGSAWTPRPRTARGALPSTSRRTTVATSPPTLTSCRSVNGTMRQHPRPGLPGNPPPLPRAHHLRAPPPPPLCTAGVSAPGAHTDGPRLRAREADTCHVHPPLPPPRMSLVPSAGCVQWSHRHVGVPWGVGWGTEGHGVHNSTFICPSVPLPLSLFTPPCADACVIVWEGGGGR